MSSVFFVALFIYSAVAANRVHSSHNHSHRGHNHSHGHSHDHSHGHGGAHIHPLQEHSAACNTLLAEGVESGDSHSPLTQQWKSAQERLFEIEMTLEDLTLADRKLGEKLYAAAVAAVTKHQEIYAHARSLKNKDIARHMEILTSIATFSVDRPLFSFYRIKRAIEGRYSLSEYIECL